MTLTAQVSSYSHRKSGRCCSHGSLSGLSVRQSQTDERLVERICVRVVVSFPPKTGPLFLETEGGCDGSETSFRRGHT